MRRTVQAAAGGLLLLLPPTTAGLLAGCGSEPKAVLPDNPAPPPDPSWRAPRDREGGAGERPPQAAGPDTSP